MQSQDKPETPADEPETTEAAPDAKPDAAPETGEAVAEDASADSVVDDAIAAAEAAVEEAESQPAAGEAEDSSAAVEDTARDIEAELADAKDKLLRALAESENVRRRASRDVENASKRAVAGFAREMVVVADNLSRALEAVDKDKIGDDGTVKSMLEGVEMTAREMQNAFARNGIKKVDPLGEKFDPQHHEAMFEYEDPSKPAGSVGQVMEPGYTLHDQPLRPAKVGVTKGGAKPGGAPTPSPQTLDEAAAEKSGTSGGSAYEDDKKPSGTNIDEEL